MIKMGRKVVGGEEAGVIVARFALYLGVRDREWDREEWGKARTPFLSFHKAFQFVLVRVEPV